MNILAIGAHADDVEIACSGTLAKYLMEGHNVKVVIMTPSDYTNYDGQVLRSYLEAFNEGYKALEILRITDIKWLGFPTKNVPYDSTTVEALNRIMDDYKPNKIFTHFPFDTHQAHSGTALATITAARNYNNIYFYEPFPPSGRSYVPFKTQLYSDISSTIELKLDSLRAHKSQHLKYGNEWIDAVRARAKLRGYECGRAYAECFEILREEL